MRILGVFEKSERVRHIGHLDIQRAVQRGLRRSGLPVSYSNGFNPHIQVTFASALSTGACGKREIMDVKMAEETDADIFLERMKQAMPPELKIISARSVDDRHPALMASLKAAEYEILIRDPLQAQRILDALPKMLEMEVIPAIRKTKSGQKETDIRPLIHQLRGKGNTIYATLALTETEACKPTMLMESLKRAAGIPEEEGVRILVTRNRLLGEDETGELRPLETL